MNPRPIGTKLDDYRHMPFKLFTNRFIKTAKSEPVCCPAVLAKLQRATKA